MIVGIDGYTENETGLLIPAAVETVTVVLPLGASAGIFNVAVADVALPTLTLLPVIPPPPATVIGEVKRLPVSVTGTGPPAAPKTGTMLLSVGSTFIETVYDPVVNELYDEAST